MLPKPSIGSMLSPLLLLLSGLGLCTQLSAHGMLHSHRPLALGQASRTWTDMVYARKLM